VTGTVFVNSGTKGSRVSVLHGQVVVDHSGEKKVLGAGEQMATHQSIAQVPVRDEISWSRDAGRYAKLLQESARVGASIDSAVAMPEVRYSTRLLDLMPAGTILYAGIPNIAAL
jgi:ferric-dicitrate binding protein FerR (iron transport regulator)